MAAKKKARRKSARGKKTGTRKPRTPKVTSTETAPGVSTEGSSKQDGRARYSVEFKTAAVARILGGERASAVGKDLGVSLMSLRQWRKKFGEGAGSPETVNAVPKRRGRPPKRLGEPPKRLGRPPKAGSAPKPGTGGIAGEMEAKLRQIEELKAEIRELAGQL